METVIKIQNLQKQFKVRKKTGKKIKDLFWPDYRTVNAVNNISFNVCKGESVAFLGPNGAGKTTTIKMLSGLIYPTHGSIDVLGYYPFDRKHDFLMRIGLVMGNKTGMNWDLTPQQSFDLSRKIYRIPKADFEKRLAMLMRLLDTDKLAEIQVKKLSLGERMKMELIGAILHDPEVLFLDEPTIGLDIISKQRIRKFLRKIQKEFNTTLLLTSHDMDDVEKVSDRVIIINKGKLVFDDQISILTARYKQTRFVKFIFDTKPDMYKLKAVTNAEVVENGSNYYNFKVKHSDMPRLIANISGKYNLVDIDILSTPLEEMIADIFVRTRDS